MTQPSQPPLSLFPRLRRSTRTVRAGDVAIGGNNPVRIQSMLTCDTMDTTACIQQTVDLVNAGCEIVRITAPTVKDAANLQHIAAGLRNLGITVPLVADIHFKPEAAAEAAKWVEKVRINPGNYADKKKFDVREYTDAEYALELDRIRERFIPLVRQCKERGVALRIGTNHGSLSDRIMNRYGDTPEGMVESALEFARIARDEGFHDFVFSMKSSNPKVMIGAYRLLAAHLDHLGPDWNYPLHLGVTEAGDGDDGRIKSAVGIGSLLADGIGDTIRVSLTEDSIHEIPVARELVRIRELPLEQDASPLPEAALPFDPFTYQRRETTTAPFAEHPVGSAHPIRVVSRVPRESLPSSGPDAPLLPELTPEEIDALPVNPLDPNSIALALKAGEERVITVADHTPLPLIGAFRLLAARVPTRQPILLKDTLDPSSPPSCDIMLDAASNLGSLLCDGIGDALWLRTAGKGIPSLRLAYNILQATGSRSFKTDYVACPSCGRTLFNLQETTARIKAATAHLKGVKIAIMGCIVNGPGEMADADFGYVGGAPGKVNLYVGKSPVKFNIPETEAVERLRELIQEHGKWVDPDTEPTPS